MDENLIPFKEEFFKECTTISFFINVLKEIQTQIEFFGYICEKDYKIYTNKAEKCLKNIEILKSNIKNYKDEPSNLYQIENQLIKFLYIYSSNLKKIYPKCLSSIKPNITPINQNIENTRKNILKHGISMLKQIRKTRNMNDLNKNITENLDPVITKTFKSLFNLYQLILIYSKEKNNLYQKIKTDVESLLKSEEINIVNNEISERNFAEKYKIKYEPLYFGNNVYRELLTDEKKDVMTLSKSFLNYTNVFIKCIQIRKKLVKELRIFFDVMQQKDKEQLERFKKVCGKITSITKSLSYSSQGIINSWNLIFSSWNSLYTSEVNNLQFQEEISNPKLIKIINECNEEYKNFEKRWEKYSEKINELRKNYSKLLKSEKTDEKLEEIKKQEEAFKNFLSIDCTDFLDNNIPLLRESEIKRANEIKDLADKIKSNYNTNLEEYIENSEKEYDNAASIDIFEEVQNIFESQLEVCGIYDSEKYFENLREKLEKIDLSDKLADNARVSLAEYYEHNDFDDDFEISKGDMENPFGAAIKENEDGIYNFETTNIAKSQIGMVEEELMSNIPNNEKNDIQNFNINFNNNTPTFNIDNYKEINSNNIIRTSEENDLYSDLKIINNLNVKFKEEAQIYQRESEDMETNKEIKNIKENDLKDNNNNNQRFDSIKDLNFINNIKEKGIEEKREEKNNNLNEVPQNKIFGNKKALINNQDKQTLHYGILGILGLFCLKSLFSSSNIFSADSFLNVVILGIISFIIYKTQFQ